MHEFESYLYDDSPLSIIIQLTFLFATSVLLVYSVALIAARRSTYVRSHFWLYVAAFFASIICTVAYQVFIHLDLNYWLAVLVVLLPATYVVQAVVSFVAGDRAIIDASPGGPRRVLPTDFNLIRRAAMFELVLLMINWHGNSAGTGV